MAQNNSKIGDDVYDRARLFHTDATLCGASAIAQKTKAPSVLRSEAETKYWINPQSTLPIYKSKCIGSKIWSHSEKAICANVSAVREWDANGTVFGYNPHRKNKQAGEFGHSDFYPIVIAACHNNEIYNGEDALKGMILLDEIRGRLAEVFSLKSYKIDHVVHGAVASAIVYGTMLNATPEQIESAVGMTVSHYVPWRAIRSGNQLSDSKGASAALSAEVAIQSVHRAIAGFNGPKDIFRNKEAIFKYFEPTQGDSSPFDLHLTTSGDDFVVMDMHFKLGLYEHQSASAISAVTKMLAENTSLLSQLDNIDQVLIKIYEPAFSIIGDHAKSDPSCR
jgi:2-methylcitrate dehydratase